ncbi:MAG: hypothetical protein GHCLOJNM_04145 [bacterium]|nr:hypothetical protein [bacterium]
MQIGATRVLSRLLALPFLFGWASTVMSASEYRAIWLDSWNPGFLDEATCRLTFERLRQHNFNLVFVEAVKTMDAHHRSQWLPRATSLTDPNYDPLGTALRFAKTRNSKLRPLEVHAWMVALRAWKEKPFPPKDQKPQHVTHAHPEWLSKTHKGGKQDAESNHFLDPGHPEVQDFVVNVAKELVTNYPVDGLHLDYIRYPTADWGYNPAALFRFQKETGRKDVPAPSDPQWSAWRREQVTAIVRRISGEIRDIRPGIALSAATITWGGIPDGDFTKTRAYKDALQDWVGWVREGLIDINVPMDYKRANDPGQSQDFVDWVKLARATNTDRHLIVGLGAWLNPLEGTKRQAEVAERLGADGVALFSYNQAESSEREPQYVLREISGSLFQDPAPVPSPGWLNRPTTGIVAGRDPQHRGGFPVLLLDGDRRKLAETRTDANGRFYFHRVKPGTYQAQVGRASLLSKPFRLVAGKVERVTF